jgi:uncharacterized membrane protein YjjP (DUF1212 family)
MTTSGLLKLLGCVTLVGAGVGCTFLALVFTGGDSAFALESGWVYTPWLVALALTVAAIGVCVLAGGPVSAVAIGVALLAYVVTLVYWFVLVP